MQKGDESLVDALERVAKAGADEERELFDQLQMASSSSSDLGSSSSWDEDEEDEGDPHGRARDILDEGEPDDDLALDGTEDDEEEESGGGSEEGVEEGVDMDRRAKGEGNESSSDADFDEYGSDMGSDGSGEEGEFGLGGAAAIPEGLLSRETLQRILSQLGDVSSLEDGIPLELLNPEERERFVEAVDAGLLDKIRGRDED